MGKAKKEKNKEQNGKKIISIIFFVIFFLVSIFVYFNNLYPKIKEPAPIVANNKNGEILDLNQNSKISIEFESDKFSGLSLAFGTYARDDLLGTINYKLINVTTKKILLNKNILLSELEDNKHYFLDTRDIEIEKEKTSYILEVNLENMHEKDSLAVYKSDSTAINTKINGISAGEGFELHIYKNVFKMLFFLYWITIIIVAIILFIVFYGVLFKKWPLIKIFVILFIIVASIYSFILPPINSPDELAHFQTSYSYTNRVFNEYEAGKLNYRISDYEKLNITYVYQTKNSITNYINFYKDFRIFNKTINKDVVSIGFDRKVVPYQYFPQTMGLIVGRILNLSFEALYLFGRFFNILFFALVVHFSLKKIPEKYRSIFYLIAFFPMTLNLVASYSSDTFIIATSFWITCQFIYIYVKNGDVLTKDYLLLFLPILLIAPIKGIYVFFSLLLLVILRDKKISKRKKILILIICFITVLLVYITLNLSNSARMMSEDVKIRGDNIPVYSFSYIFENPLSFLKIYFRSIVTSFNNNIKTAIGRHISWFTIPMSSYVIDGYLILCIFCIFSHKENIFNIKDKIIFLSTFCGIYFAAYGIMFIGHTPVGNAYIEGIQGRYFLPALPLLFLIFRPKKPLFAKDISTTLFLIGISLTSFSIIDILKNMS